MEKQYERVDELFQKWDTTHSPGCALAIIKNGKIEYKKGYGLANLEHRVPVQTDSEFYIASTSKQFAAFSIALLEEEGLLSVSDDIRKYVPEIPDYGSPIQIQHLIHHTSGMRDYLALNALSGRHYDELITPEDALLMISRQKELNFPTGDRYLYSNSGYFLLSVIVERVSGKTLRQFAQEKIFGPLGMQNTHFHDDRTEPVYKRATGYRFDAAKGYRISVPGLETVGSGGIYSTVEDLALWDRNFYNNQLGLCKPDLLERILIPGVLNNGDVLDYAFGLTIQNYKGVKKIGHSGGYGGYSAEFIRFPEHTFTVVCISNNSTLPAPSMALRVADIFLAEFYDEDSKPQAEIQTVELPVESLLGKDGYYVSQNEETIVKINQTESGLALDLREMQFPLAASTDTQFHLVNAPISADLTFEGEGEAWVLTFDMKRGQPPETLEKFHTQDAARVDLENLCGEYFSKELNATAIITLIDNNLVLQIGRHQAVFIPGMAGKYIIEGEVFSRALLTVKTSGGIVQSFRLNAGRVNNIEFIRR